MKKTLSNYWKPSTSSNHQSTASNELKIKQSSTALKKKSNNNNTRIRPHHQQNPQKTAHYWNTISYTAVQCSLTQRVLPGTVESHSVSPFPIMLKVLKKLILKRLLPVVEKNQLYQTISFGFRQSHFTIEQTHRIVQRINEALERKQYFLQHFLDITQTFVKVWHTELMYKLKTISPFELFPCPKILPAKQTFPVQDRK
jgi:hypothetical protein